MMSLYFDTIGLMGVVCTNYITGKVSEELVIKRANALLYEKLKAMLVDATQQSTRTIAYVDGTYSEKLERYGYGVVIRQNGKCWKYSGSASDKDMVSMNSVAGGNCGAPTAKCRKPICLFIIWDSGMCFYFMKFDIDYVCCIFCKKTLGY